MSKKKLLFLIIILYILFAIVVITAFYRVSRNPIDQIAITYIRNDSYISSNYGNIVHVGKNVLYETIKSDSTIKSPYTIETEKCRVIVYVTLSMVDQKYEAISLEVIEVIPNDS